MHSGQELNYLYTIASFSIILFLIAVGVVALYQSFRKNIDREKLAQEELKNKHQQVLLTNSISAQEDERKRIARDLHDELGATLSLARMQLAGVQQSFDHVNIEWLHQINGVETLVALALATTRRISHELMPPQLQAFGLIETLRLMAESATIPDHFKLKIYADDVLPPLNWPVQIGLYRVTLELINNTLKHAGADTIEIRIVTKNQILLYMYNDNGKNENVDKQRSNGMGIINIQARIQALGGKTVLDMGDGKGFRADIQIPIKPSLNY